MNVDEQQVGWQGRSKLRPGLPGYLLRPTWNSKHNQKKTQPSVIMTSTGLTGLKSVPTSDRGWSDDLTSCMVFIWHEKNQTDCVIIRLLEQKLDAEIWFGSLGLSESDPYWISRLKWLKRSTKSCRLGFWPKRSPDVCSGYQRLREPAPQRPSKTSQTCYCCHTTFKVPRIISKTRLLEAKRDRSHSIGVLSLTHRASASQLVNMQGKCVWRMGEPLLPTDFPSPRLPSVFLFQCLYLL